MTRVHHCGSDRVVSLPRSCSRALPAHLSLPVPSGHWQPLIFPPSPRLAFSGMACSWNHAAHFFSCRIRFHGVDGPQLAHSVTRRTSVGEHAHAGFHADMRLRLLWANSTEHGCRAPCRMFRFVRNRHTVFQRCRAALRARQRRVRLPGSPHPRQRLASLVFRIAAMLIGVACISLF